MEVLCTLHKIIGDLTKNSGILDIPALLYNLKLQILSVIRRPLFPAGRLVCLPRVTRALQCERSLCGHTRGAVCRGSVAPAAPWPPRLRGSMAPAAPWSPRLRAACVRMVPGAGVTGRKYLEELCVFLFMAL